MLLSCNMQMSPIKCLLYHKIKDNTDSVSKWKWSCFFPELCYFLISGFSSGSGLSLVLKDQQDSSEVFAPSSSNPVARAVTTRLIAARSVFTCSAGQRVGFSDTLDKALNAVSSERIINLLKLIDSPTSMEC